MRNFISTAAPIIHTHFAARQPYLDMLMRFNTTAEEWFRIELLRVFQDVPGIEIVGTNHQTQQGADRPDFTLSRGTKEALIELKVLPKDRNYLSGWQRFQAGENNRKDFENLVAGTRHGVIYVYWPDQQDWQSCRGKLERGFAVDCIREDVTPCSIGALVVSYWAPKERCNDA